MAHYHSRCQYFENTVAVIAVVGVVVTAVAEIEYNVDDTDSFADFLRFDFQYFDKVVETLGFEQEASGALGVVEPGGDSSVWSMRASIVLCSCSIQTPNVHMSFRL